MFPVIFFLLFSSSIFQQIRIHTSVFRLGFCYMNQDYDSYIYDTKLFRVEDRLINLEISSLRRYLTEEKQQTEEKLISQFVAVVKYVLKDNKTFILAIDANDIRFSDKNYIDFIVALKKVMKTQFLPFHEKTVVKNCSPIVKTIMTTFFKIFLDKSEMRKVVFT